LVAYPFTLICIVLASDPPSTQRQGCVDLTNQLSLILDSRVVAFEDGVY
jgi:hypothetical protein